MASASMPALAQAAQTGSESIGGVQDTSVQDSYAGYTIFRCLGATIRTYRASMRHADTARYERREAFPAPLRLAAQRCVGGWNIDSVPAAELAGLARLYTLAGDTVRANRVVTRQFALAHTPAERVGVFETIAENYMPYLAYVDWPGVMRVLDQLKTIPGDDAARARLRIDQALIVAVMGSTLGDDSAAFRVVNDGLAAASVLTLAEEREAIVKQFNSLHRQIAMMNGDSISLAGAAIKMQPLHGTMLLGSGMYPKPGKINLVFFDLNRKVIPALRRLKAKYGDAIEVVYLGSTHGSFQLKAPLTFAQESAALTRYATSALKLPELSGAYLLEQSTISKFPEPDGRLIPPAPTPNFRTYSLLGSLVIVDGDGKIRNAYPGLSAMSTGLESRLERALDRILKKEGGG